jgi:hypothetical protein
MKIIQLFIKLSCWKLMDIDEQILKESRTCPGQRPQKTPVALPGSYR